MTVIGYLLLGLAAGAVAATLGIGGGIVIVPALVVFFAFPQHLAQGTSLAVILPTAVIGTVVHARGGRVDWRIAVQVAAGGIVGAVVGSRLAISLDPLLLRRLFATLLLVLVFRLARRSGRSRIPEGHR